MYRKKDIPRTLRAASLLADTYKGQNDAKLLMLNYELIELCGNPSSNSTFFLITKEAITAAVNIIEGAGKELPSEDVVSLICRMLMYIPGCCHDGKFAISIAERIYMFYTVASDAQLHIIRMFLPELERGFAFAYKALSQIDEEDSAYLRVLAKCREILFNPRHRKPLKKHLNIQRTRFWESRE